MEQFLGSKVFILLLTIATYLLSQKVYRQFRLAILHPVLITCVVTILFLLATGIDYAHYRKSVNILQFALEMSVVALGYLMYEQISYLKGRLIPIFVSIIVGAVVAIVSVVVIAQLFGVERDIITSIAPKSITVPIAVAVVEPLGGIVSITSVVVFCTGILGSIFGPWTLRRCGIKDPLAVGFALGSAAHGIGTARAIEMGAKQGALSGLAMALMGVITAIILPIIEKYLY